MGNFTINMIFAAVFAGIAWNSLPRGWRFFRIGWQTYNAHAGSLDEDPNIERQRDLQSGTGFMLAGLGWLGGGLVSGALALLFAIFAFLDVGIFNLTS